MRLHSNFAKAIVLFAFVNALLFYGYGRARMLQSGLPLPQGELCDSCLRNVRVWDEAAIDSAVKKIPTYPNVVLVGSSAMIAPFWSADRSLDNTIPNRLWLHHRANLLTDQSSSKTVADPRIYNLSTPLQMVSDTYVYVDKLLKGPKRPSLIVLGVTPREFYDHDFPEPDKTLNFLAAAPYSNWAYLNICCPTFGARSEYLADQLCFLYSKRGFVQTTLAARARKYASKHLPTMQSEKQQFEFGYEQYARRYEGFGEAKLTVQLSYLKRLAKLCQERDSELAVVNLPLPFLNRQILGSKYEQYCAKLRQATAACEDVDYIDLSHSPKFADSDFADAIHLNSTGGKKLIGILAPYVRSELDDGDHKLAAR